jgi:hypothetical protein
VRAAERIVGGGLRRNKAGEWWVKLRLDTGEFLDMGIDGGALNAFVPPRLLHELKAKRDADRVRRAAIEVLCERLGWTLDMANQAIRARAEEDLERAREISADALDRAA